METPQEEFWAGEFGNDYIGRNQGPSEVAANLHIFTSALKRAGPIKSVVELGANIGMNLEALKLLYPGIHCSGVEINAAAAAQLQSRIDHVDECSLFDWWPKEAADLALIKGVLIHINPDRLDDVYERLYSASRRYILICEYYNPTPVAVRYRGHDDKLFKRDFAGEMMDKYPDFKLIDYGFAYRRDPAFVFDDQTWFLLER